MAQFTHLKVETIDNAQKAVGGLNEMILFLNGGEMANVDTLQPEMGHLVESWIPVWGNTDPKAPVSEAISL